MFSFMSVVCACAGAESEVVDTIAVDEVVDIIVLGEALNDALAETCKVLYQAEPVTVARQASKHAERPPATRRLHQRAGQLCTHLTQPTAERALARYRVDDEAGRFVLDLGEGFDVPQFSCHVSDIEDIYQIGDGEVCFPSSILASLAPHELESLCMLVVRDPSSQQPTSICLLEESRCGLEDMLSRLGRLLRAHTTKEQVAPQAAQLARMQARLAAAGA